MIVETTEKTENESRGKETSEDHTRCAMNFLLEEIKWDACNAPAGVTTKTLKELMNDGAQLPFIARSTRRFQWIASGQKYVFFPSEYRECYYAFPVQEEFELPLSDVFTTCGIHVNVWHPEYVNLDAARERHIMELLGVHYVRKT